MTAQTLSNKRAKRLQKPAVFAANKLKRKTETAMEVDNTSEQEANEVRSNQEGTMGVIENHQKNGYSVVSDPEGTTLGIQSF